jgi:hypothetical protein
MYFMVGTVAANVKPSHDRMAHKQLTMNKILPTLIFKILRLSPINYISCFLFQTSIRKQCRQNSVDLFARWSYIQTGVFT